MPGPGPGPEPTQKEKGRVAPFSKHTARRGIDSVGGGSRHGDRVRWNYDSLKSRGWRRGPGPSPRRCAASCPQRVRAVQPKPPAPRDRDCFANSGRHRACQAVHRALASDVRLCAGRDQGVGAITPTGGADHALALPAIAGVRLTGSDRPLQVTSAWGGSPSPLSSMRQARAWLLAALNQLAPACAPSGRNQHSSSVTLPLVSTHEHKPVGRRAGRARRNAMRRLLKICYSCSRALRLQAKRLASGPGLQWRCPSHAPRP